MSKKKREYPNVNEILSKPVIEWSEEEITELAEYALSSDPDIQAELLSYGMILTSAPVKRAINSYINKSALCRSGEREDIMQECMLFLYDYVKNKHHKAEKKCKPIRKILHALRPHGAIGRQFFGPPEKIEYEKLHGTTLFLIDYYDKLICSEKDKNQYQ